MSEPVIPERLKRTGINDGPPQSIYQYEPVKNASPLCPQCMGLGIVDSGGIHPWGDAAMVMCDCVHRGPYFRKA